MQKILLKNVKLIKNDDLLLSNISISFNFDQNVVIVPKNVGKSSSDIRSVQALIKLIAGRFKPTAGSVEYEVEESKRIIVGYKNLEHLFKRSVSVFDFLNTLIKTQKIDEDNYKQIKEIRNMLQINKESKLNELEYNQTNLLNLLTLLIIKPHFILIDNLSLPGSATMQLTILEYIKNYCKNYNINLIISTNDNDVVKTVADRIITINNHQIISDHDANEKVEEESNLEEDILSALNLNLTANDLEQDILNSINQKPNEQKKSPQETNEDDDSGYFRNIRDVEQVDHDLIYQVTKALDDSYEDDVVISMKNTDEINPVEATNSLSSNYKPQRTSTTSDLLTIRYETNAENEEFFETKKQHSEFENDELSKKYEKPVSLNKHFTGSVEFAKEEIAEKTRKLNDDSKEILQDIKFQHKQNDPTKNNSTNNFKYDDESIDVELNEYMTKEFLHEIRETYAMKKALSDQIKSSDFHKLTPELQQKVFNNYEAADKLIKEIDPKGLYDPSKSKGHVTKKIITTNNDTNGFKSVTEAMVSEELSFDDNKTIKPEELTNALETKITYKDETNTLQPSTKKIENGDYYYKSKENKNNKRSKWIDRFSRDSYNNSKHKTSSFEPTSKIDINNNNESDNKHQYNNQNKNFNYKKTSYFDQNQQKPYKTKNLKTMAIKQRSKKNSIEKLYEEAVEDAQIIKEFKDKKNRGF